MWAIITPYLLKYGVPLAIQILEKTGAINATEAWGLKAWVAAKQLHKYYKPEDFPNPPPQPTVPNNLIIGTQ